MNNKKRIQELCRKYTDYTERQISIIIEKAHALDELAEIFDCDIFIDVPLIDSTASIVVYHVIPVLKESLYKKTPVGQLALKMNEPGVWKVSRKGGKLRGYKAFTQEDAFIRQDVYAINDGKQILGTYIFEKSLKETEQSDNEVKNDYMTMTAKLNNYIDDAIYFFNASGKLIFQNDVADSVSNDLSSENLYYNDLFGEQIPYSELVLNDSKKFIKEIQIDNKYFMLKRILLKDDKLEFAIILRDITLLKDKEAEIFSKTEAIREIHHRIKNNLQTMASLLRMERRRTDDSQVREVLTDNMNRIMSIAATHDILARQLGDEVDLSSVLKFIVNNIHRSYSIMDHIKIMIEANESVIVPSDMATSVSLIINELVQNSYDHAFPNQAKGEILVSIQEEEEEVVLSVIDNGIGFHIDKVEKNSLGLIIVQNYVKDKLEGNIQFNKKKNGMEITFRFNANVADTMEY